MLHGSSTRIPFIQGLRGLAVSLVVLYHAGFLFNGGFIGVDIFFVISGFVIGQSLSREIVQTG
ncbi:MAG: acyltransferase family protein, partial [Ilumatobacteraceae bacterium]